MDRTPKTTSGKAPSTAMIELDGVAHEGDKLIAFFSSGTHRWEIQCKAADLQKFARFQAKVADTLGLWVEHDSQDQPRAGSRVEDWNYSVWQAWGRGGSG